jgi:hypothetical protein
VRRGAPLPSAMDMFTCAGDAEDPLTLEDLLSLLSDTEATEAPVEVVVDTAAVRANENETVSDDGPAAARSELVAVVRGASAAAPPAAPSEGCCWGEALAAGAPQAGACVPFVPGSKRFCLKFCPGCRARGIVVPADRLAILPKGTKNCPIEGSPWSETGGVPPLRYRTLRVANPPIGTTVALFAARAPPALAPAPFAYSTVDEATGARRAHLVADREGLVLRTPAPQRLTPAEQCWGALLAGPDARRPCEPFVRGKRFQDKFCAACIRLGVCVPAARVRVPTTVPGNARHNNLAFWNDGAYAVRHRLLRHLRLVVLEAPLPSLAEAPARLVSPGGTVRLFPRRDDMALERAAPKRRCAESSDDSFGRRTAIGSSSPSTSRDDSFGGRSASSSSTSRPASALRTSDSDDEPPADPLRGAPPGVRRPSPLAPTPPPSPPPPPRRTLAHAFLDLDGATMPSTTEAALVTAVVGTYAAACAHVAYPFLPFGRYAVAWALCRRGVPSHLMCVVLQIVVDVLVSVRKEEALGATVRSFPVDDAPLAANALLIAAVYLLLGLACRTCGGPFLVLVCGYVTASGLPVAIPLAASAAYLAGRALARPRRVAVAPACVAE